MLGSLRSRLGIYGIVTLVVAVVTILALAGYRIYYQTLASTPEKAVASYLDVLNKGDMARLYEMTLASSGQSQAEFANQLGALVKDKRLSTSGAAITPIGRHGNSFYFRLTAKLLTSDGSYRFLPVMLEAAQEGTAWHVALFVPPTAMPVVAAPSN